MKYVGTVVKREVGRKGFYFQETKPFCLSIDPTWEQLGSARKAQVHRESKRLGMIMVVLPAGVLFFNADGPVTASFHK